MAAAVWQLALRAQVGDLALDLELESDQARVVVVGPNGAGKTSLLRLLTGTVAGVQGRAQVGDHLLLDSAARVDLAPERRRLGYVPQGYGLFPHLSAEQNVAFGLAGEPDREARVARARELLAQLDAAPLAERMPAELSGGEKQRVALARALALSPDALLLDEPLAALDVSTRRATRAFLADYLARSDRPALIVSHDLRDVVAFAQDVVVIDAGRVVQQGPPAALSAAPANDFVAELFEVSPLSTAPTLAK